MTSETEPKMRAWSYNTPGPPSTVLTLSQSVAVPKLVSPTSVLVAVSHSALNPSDIVVMQNVPSVVRSSPPWIPGLDFSGSIKAIGSAVVAQRPEFKVGAEVFGIVPVSAHVRSGVGALGEFTVADVSTIVCKPPNVAFAEAAGLCVVGCSSLMLLDKAGLQKGQKVLVYGGNGGVGSVTVQLAKRAVGEEGKVIAVCSQGNIDFVKSLGADEVIDYKAHKSLPSYLTSKYSEEPFDSIIDTVGIQELYANCASYLAPGKTFVSIGVKITPLNTFNLIRAGATVAKNTALPRLFGGVGRPYVAVSMTAPSREHLEELSRLVEVGELKSVVDSEWSMEDALQAYERSLTQSLRGKVVIKVGSSEDTGI